MTEVGGSSEGIQENPPKRIHQRTLINTKTIFSNKHINKKNTYCFTDLLFFAIPI